MKLLDYMSERAEVVRAIDSCDEWDTFVSDTDNCIRRELNLNRGRMNLPEDWHEVMDWLDGASIDVLCDIDIEMGGVFYYYLCRIGLA